MVSEYKDATRSRIMEATLQLMLSAGLEQISTKSIYRAAKVSRTTLYRHFPSREALLEGVIGYQCDDIERRLKLKIAERPDPKYRLDLVIDMMIERQERDMGRRLLRVDPGFVMKMLDQTLQRNVDAFNDALADVYTRVEEVTGTRVQALLIGNVMTRLIVSLTLLPSQLPPGELREAVRSVFRSLLFGQIQGIGVSTSALDSPPRPHNGSPAADSNWPADSNWTRLGLKAGGLK
jgi:AcrR family transcriptional regulator